MSNKQDISNVVPIAVDRITFGVRFQPRYEMADHFGAIIDRILRTKGSPFHSGTFPLGTRDPGIHILYHRDTEDELRLTDRDIILDMKIDSRKISDIETLGDNFTKYVLSSINEVTKLRQVTRYGVLLRLAECRSLLQETPVERFIQKDFRDARSMTLRFTRRLSVIDAIIKKGVNDYRNVIYTVRQTDGGEVKIEIDYQEYFDPSLDIKDIAQKPFTDFVDRGIGYFLGEFQNWLKKLIGKNEAA